jgi:hypothetical protein
MNKLAGGAVVLGLLWGAVKIGLLDAVIGGVISDLAAELERLAAPLAALLVAVALPCALVGLLLLVHKKRRGLGIELMVIAAVLIFGARLAPVVTHWMSSEATAISSDLSRTTILGPAAAPAPAATPVVSNR